MRQQRGFSLMEIIIALAISAVALVAFLSVFSSSNDQAVGSRNRSVAILLTESLMDDIDTHIYGSPAPQRWSQETEHPVEVWVYGRQQKVTFHKTIVYENGSFVGTSNQSSDLVTITVTWREGFGDDRATGSDNKEFEVRVPVWR